MDIIKKDYPYAKIISYKYNKDFRTERPKDYKNRILTVAFVNNYKDIWK